ncbi:MAG: hypothetical protein ACM3H8_12925 [Sphingobacteriales bacterium]
MSMQLMFFFGSSKIIDASNPIKKVWMSPFVMDDYTKALVESFVGFFALRLIIYFIFSGEFRTISLVRLMLSPYCIFLYSSL